MANGPYMSYKSIFKRKSRIYKIGDIKIPWGVTIDQGIGFMVVILIGFLLYMFVPALADAVGLIRFIVGVAILAVAVYLGIGKIDFRGLGLITGLLAVGKWFFEPKRTLMDVPQPVLMQESIKVKITSGFRSDNHEEVLSLARLSSFVIQDSAIISLSQGYVYVKVPKKPHKKQLLSSQDLIEVDQRKKKIIKLASGVHTFRRVDDMTWQYIKGGSAGDGEFSY